MKPRTLNLPSLGPRTHKPSITHNPLHACYPSSNPNPYPITVARPLQNNPRAAYDRGGVD